MIFTTSNKVQDQIILYLSKKELTAKDLNLKISNHSLRSIYKGLNNLITQGVVFKLKDVFFLDREWVNKTISHLSLNYALLPKLNVGESITYKFNNFSQVDLLWKSINLSHQPDSSPLVIYNSHNFWPYVPGRSESEQQYYASVDQTQPLYFVIGSNDSLDKAFKKRYQNNFFKINLEPNRSFDRRNHITIINNLVISVVLRKVDSDSIDKIFNSDNSVDNQEKLLRKFLGEPTKIIFKIENKPKKASSLRKQLLKNFFIPTSIE